MMTQRKAMATKVVLAVIMIILVVGVSASLLAFSPHPASTTEPTTSTSTSVTISGDTFLAQCPGWPSSGSGFGFVTTGPSSPAVICLQIYYYNAPFAPVTLNLTSAISIQAVQYIANGSGSSPRTFDGMSNFTIVPSQSQLTIGGPKNESEGTVIFYAILSKPGASGTYELGLFPSSSLSVYMLGPQESESCGVYGQILAGDGRPNYAQENVGCMNVVNVGGLQYKVPGIPYQLRLGDTYFRMDGVTNTSGIGLAP